MDSIATNPMFTAGAGLIGIGAGVAILRQGALHGLQLAERYWLTTLEIPSHDKSYYWVLQWITQHSRTRTKHLSVRTSFTQHDNGSVATTFHFLPGPGRHYFQWRGVWFQMERLKEKSSSMMATGGALAAAPMENVTLTALTRNTAIMEEVLKAAKSLALSSEEGKTVLYTSWGHEWRPFGSPRRRRPLSSVILDKGVSERIVQDVQEFLTSGRWYIERGIPYRRGYLLYGPPGSGKSSFIQALAGHLEYNICIMNLSEKYLTDDRLNLLLSSTPQRSIVLLEDVDAAFTFSRQKASTEGNALTFSGFLNALDGVASSEGRLIFMTTNHLERLDEALLRPGRVDLKCKIDHATRDQVERMFLRFYDVNESIAKTFSARLLDRVVSAAQLQGYFLTFKDDPNAAIRNVDQL